VNHNRLLIGRQLHIKFYAVNAEREGKLECRQRILGRKSRSASVTDDQRIGLFCRRVHRLEVFEG
jgi:hypothetical protein